MVTGVQLDPCGAIVSQIARYGSANIPVPALSSLLGVKSTTLNARFRRNRIPVSTIGRTNYIPHDQALKLVELHRYALIGWPTLLDASRITAVKPGTLKAMCEKGRLEGHVDLTKRLRLNPTELSNLRAAGSAGEAKSQQSRARTATRRSARPDRAAVSAPLNSISQPEGSTDTAELSDIDTHLSARDDLGLDWTANSEVILIRSQDPGLPDPGYQPRTGKQPPEYPKAAQKHSGRLVYDPLRPFSLSVCKAGYGIIYGQYVGTILGVIDDPYTPKIKVAFPEHEHPAMREVLLIVGKRKQAGSWD